MCENQIGVKIVNKFVPFIRQRIGRQIGVIIGYQFRCKKSREKGSKMKRSEEIIAHIEI